MIAEGAGARPPILVLAMGGAFLLLVISLLIGSLTRPELPPYGLTTPHPAPAGDSLLGPATYTLDAAATDRWRRFDFGRNAAVESGPWDIAFRRFHVISAPGGGIVDLGVVPFDSVRELPAAGYVENIAAPDTTNPGVGKWYTYSMLTHLLMSKHHVYGVRTAGGRYAKLELLAYYCREVGTACVTFRYAYQGDGTRRVAPPSEEPPAVLGRGLASSVAGASSFGRQDLEHPRTAYRADALQGRPAVGHLHLLGVGDLPLGLALHTVPLIRSHRGLSGLRHCVPPFGGRGRGAGCMGWGSGAAPPGSPPRDGDNIIRCAQIVGAEA